MTPRHRVETAVVDRGTRVLELHWQQGEVLRNESRFRVLAAGRRWGKTTLMRSALLESAAERPGRSPENWHAYIGPDLQQARRVMWRPLIEAVPRSWIEKEPNQTRMEIQLVTGQILVCLGADNPDCYDSETEVLTDQGWKLFADLDRTERLFAADPEAFVGSFQRPTCYIDQPYCGPMVAIHSKKIDLLVTPNHKLVVRSRKSGRRVLKTARELSCNDAIPAAAGFDGIDDPAITADHCALMGFFLAEGSAYGSRGGDITKRRGNYEVVFCQTVGVKGGTKGDVRTAFKAVLQRLGYNPRENKIGLYLTNKALWQQLRPLGNAHTKRIPTAYKNLPPAKLRVLLHWMLMGYGSLRGGIGRSLERVYYTVNRGLADDVQEIAAKAGFGSTLRSRVGSGVIKGRAIQSSGPMWHVSIFHSQAIQLRNPRGSYISEQHYDGRVYCVEVPGHLVLVRRHGRVCWSGNSLRGMGFRRLVLDEYADMPGDEIWEPILLPALLTAGGDALIGGTPKGYDHFYDLWRRGKEKRKNWASWQFRTSEAPHITPEMYAALVAEYTDPRIMRQELEASFESSSGTILGHLWQADRVVLATDTQLLRLGLRANTVIPWHVIPNANWIPPKGAAIYGSVDYGFGAPAALYLHAATAGGHVRTFWELYQRELHDDEQAKRLRQAIEFYMSRGCSAPEWIVLEPVMFGSRRELRIAKSIAEVYADHLQSVTQIMQGAGGRSARLSRPQRWMSALQPAADGLPSWTITTACPHAIRSVPRVRWDEKDPEVDADGDNHSYESIGRLFEARPVGPRQVVADPYEGLDPISRAHHVKLAAKGVARTGGGQAGLGNVAKG